ncbi:hypothetical protein HNQ91_003927 [Filimonas zeae]|uniref:Outer membrane protein beta-barrel domain-containing protein n=1 Tax=Filimonas zeae TaxID=1737353 RepID=A0A917J1W3_9BACT|nr:hypothetical protein [Filimonas zeae]MDR6340854.1 hypothetical protein [Filimonas zeae]GGH78190.1 hypothetical protein GCM10011379_45710 [Filimonas zeae]
MHENLHNDPFTDGSFVPHIPAAQAWQNMETLLNTHLPAQTRKAAWWLTGLQVGLVAMFLLLVSVPLKDSLFSGIFLAQPQEKTAIAPVAPMLAVVEKVSSEPVRSLPLPAATPVQLSGTHILPGSNTQWAEKLINAAPDTIQTDTPVSTKAGAAIDSVKKAAPTPQRKNKWQLLAGLGTNYVIGGNTQYMAPYPTAELRYFINKRIYVAAGIAIGAPVASDEKIIEKDVTYYDQVTNETKTYNQLRSINRAVYTDVPVTAGMQLNKHWSVATGVQMSFLNKVVSSRYMEDYAATFRQVMVYSPGLVGPTAIVEEKPEPEVPVAQKDFRGLAALTWQAGKWQVTGQYQRSFSQGHKNIVSLKLQYRLK